MEEPYYEEGEIHERREAAKKPKYQFPWCDKCDLLGGCYYQHGEFNGPMFINQECGEGPYKNL